MNKKQKQFMKEKIYIILFIFYSSILGYFSSKFENIFIFLGGIYIPIFIFFIYNIIILEIEEYKRLKK